MQRSNRELWAAFLAILLISLVYFWNALAAGEFPGPSNATGHWIGVAGFGLMLMTETLYTWRKRSRKASLGRMAQWLNFHIFTGIVGPYMVLLHSAWRFQGLAGVTLLLTALIVLSGFIGRYIYTAVPRSVEGIEIEAEVLEAEIAAGQRQMAAWAEAHPIQAEALGDLGATPPGDASSGGLVLLRGWRVWQARRKRQAAWQKAIRKGGDSALRKSLNELEGLVRRQQTLQRQLASLATARRLLAAWHTVHLPIGLVLFTAATIHILATLYFVTLEKLLH
jgi:hypothetical protein